MIMLPWLPPFPVAKTWDESKHPRDDGGRFAHIHGAIAGKLGWDAADYRAAAKLSPAGLKQTAATAGVSAADLKGAIAERNEAKPTSRPTGAELAALVHTAAVSIPDPFGNSVENAHGNHKVYVADLYDKLGGRLGGMSLDEFKAGLMAAMQAGHLSLGRSDMLPYTKDPAQGRRSEIVHPSHEGATFHVVNVPVKGKAFGR